MKEKRSRKKGRELPDPRLAELMQPPPALGATRMLAVPPPPAAPALLAEELIEQKTRVKRSKRRERTER